MSKACFCVLGMAALVAQAGTYTWNGGAEGAWSDVANWNCDGAPATGLPTNADSVNLAGTKATLVLSEDVDVGFLWAFQEGSEITIRTDTPGTRRALAVKRSWNGPLGGWGGGFPGPVTAGTKLVLEGVKLFPNYESELSQWGLNTQEVRFRSACTLQATDCELYFGKLAADATLRLELKDSTIWPREYGTVKGLDVVLDDSQWTGYKQALTVTGDATFTFKGTKPQLSCVGGTPNPNVSGALTFRYVLPASPYAEAPVVNGAEVDFAPPGTFAVEIAEDSPAFTSGTLQHYPLIAYTKSTTCGLNLADARLPALRTPQETFMTAFMAGADTSGLPQYLNVTIDGSYDPANAPLAATFAAPVPTADGECFSGTVSELGSGATSATLTLRYGLDGALDQEALLGTVSATGPFSFALTGLDDEAEYAYVLTLTNDKGASVSSAAGTFSRTCGSVLSDAVTLTLNNGRGTVAGTLAVVGAGTTTVKLLVGRSEATLQEVAAQETSASAFSFDYVFPDEGEWKVRFVCTNVLGSRSWTDETSVAARTVSVADTCTYGWTGGEGRWDDSANWLCTSANAGLGHPTSRSEAVFGADVQAVVTLPSDITVAKLTVGSNNGDVTFKGANATLIAASIAAKGNGTTLTLDGVKLTDNASVWNLDWKLEPGAGSVIRLRNGATLQVKEFNPQADDVLIDVSGGSTCFIRESWSGNTYDFRVLVEDAVFEVPDKRLLISEIVFRGTTPTVKVCGLADRPVRLVYELPETPYAAAPLRQSTMVASSVKDLTTGQATVVISADSPARTARRSGTYRLVAWDAPVSGVPKGIASDVLAAVKGIKGLDAISWGRAAGVAASDLPQYLDVTLKSSGLALILR